MNNIADANQLTRPVDSIIDSKKTIAQQQAMAMLELQSAMNSKVNPDWINAGYPFLRAVVIEGAEAIEHHGYKWWKAQTPDMEQVKMEIIDIWHFILSDLIIRWQGNLEAAAMEITSKSKHVARLLTFDGIEYRIYDIDMLRKLELVIGLAAARRTSIPLIKSLLADCDMDWDDLYAHYIAKNVLNLFRQDHGYKNGTYRKMWASREDNEHLVEIMDRLNPADPDYQKTLYESLCARYAALA